MPEKQPYDQSYSDGKLTLLLVSQFLNPEIPNSCMRLVISSVGP